MIHHHVALLSLMVSMPVAIRAVRTKGVVYNQMLIERKVPRIEVNIESSVQGMPITGSRRNHS